MQHPPCPHRCTRAAYEVWKFDATTEWTLASRRATQADATEAAELLVRVGAARSCAIIRTEKRLIDQITHQCT